MGREEKGRTRQAAAVNPLPPLPASGLPFLGNPNPSHDHIQKFDGGGEEYMYFVEMSTGENSLPSDGTSRAIP